MPKISILTAVRADTSDKVLWLRECVESVKAQDFQDWEMVVVDDESPLLVGEALHPYDQRVLYARANPKAGTSMCRNTAAALATGEAFLPLDADDKLPAGALTTLWEAWERSRDRIVYGNAQQFGLAERHLPFPAFNTIHDVLNLSGIVPVTAMHSPRTWEDAGGWKAEFEHGLEDVEYWISAAAAGHCGLKVEATTLLYRKHHESRSSRMRREHTQSLMEDRIRERHKDIYAGRLPMGCCGGSSSRAADIPQPRRNEGARLPPSNAGAGDTVWVRYNGAMAGTFGVASPNVKGHVYQVQGTGHVFEIYAVDANFLQRQGRGLHFTVGVPSPAKEEPPSPAPEPQREYVAPKPQVARIERMPVREPPPLAEVVDVTEPPERKDPLQSVTTVGDEIKAMLRREGWTVPALARATADELTPYKGIGEAKARKLIEEAKTLWGI